MARYLWQPLLLSVLVFLFTPLLVHHERVPAADPAISRVARAETKQVTRAETESGQAGERAAASPHGAEWLVPYVEAEVQRRVEVTTGLSPFFEWSGPAPASRGPWLLGHPLFAVLSRLLPLGLTASVVVLAHLIAGALAAWALLRRLGDGEAAATLGATLFVVTGALIDVATTPSATGHLQAAALFPLLVLTLVRAIEAPAVSRGTVLGVVVALVCCSGSLSGVLLCAALAAPACAVLLRESSSSIRRVQQGSGSGAAPDASVLSPAFSSGALIVIYGVVWGGLLGAYRLLPALLDGAALSELARPWWRGGEGGTALPFHLGAVALVLWLAGAQTVLRSPRARALHGRLVLGAVGLAIVVAGPIAALPFAGFFIAAVATSALAGAWLTARPKLRAALAVLALALVIADAIPVQAPRLEGASIAAYTNARVERVAENEFRVGPPYGVLAFRVVPEPTGHKAGMTLSSIALLAFPVLLVLPLFELRARRTEYRRRFVDRRDGRRRKGDRARDVRSSRRALPRSRVGAAEDAVVEPAAAPGSSAAGAARVGCHPGDVSELRPETSAPAAPIDRAD